MQIIKDRRNLHRIPELELTLPKTMEYLRQELTKLNCRVFAPMDSALCAWFDFGKDAAIAFRADCDALPICEKTGAEYASTHAGRMHACGHDGHMAILLELARRLNEKKSLPHNVLLVFQPGEESPGGARLLCDTGVLEEHNVRAIFGLHLWPALEKGVVFSRKQELMSRASEINVDIYGKSAHIAKAAEGIDATACGLEFYRRVRALEAGLPKEVFRLANFGKFHSGTVRNAISAHAHMEGSIRAFQDEVFETLRDGICAIGREVEKEMDCRVEVWVGDSYPAVMNPPALYDRVAALADIRALDVPTMTAEDFSWYQKRVPGMFFFLGLGDTPALHADTFDFDETILLKGAEFFENLAENFL